MQGENQLLATGVLVGLAIIGNIAIFGVVVAAVAIAARWVMFGTLPW